MSINLQYIYAQIDLRDNQCIGIETTTIDRSGDPEYVVIDSLNEAYLGKYYINGEWFEDAEGNIPWSLT